MTSYEYLKDSREDIIDLGDVREDPRESVGYPARPAYIVDRTIGAVDVVQAGTESTETDQPVVDKPTSVTTRPHLPEIDVDKLKADTVVKTEADRIRGRQGSAVGKSVLANVIPVETSGIVRVTSRSRPADESRKPGPNTRANFAGFSTPDSASIES